MERFSVFGQNPNSTVPMLSRPLPLASAAATPKKICDSQFLMPGSTIAVNGGETASLFDVACSLSRTHSMRQQQQQQLGGSSRRSSARSRTFRIQGWFVVSVPQKGGVFDSPCLHSRLFILWLINRSMEP